MVGRKKCVEENYLDFLSLLTLFERAELRLHQLFKEIADREVTLPPCYLEIATSYVILENTEGSPEMALRKLARQVESPKLKRFLESYTIVIETTGETSSFVENELRSEVASVKGAVDRFNRILEALYEGEAFLILSWMIILLVLSLDISLYALMSIVLGAGLGVYLYALKTVTRVASPPSWITMLDIALLATSLVTTLSRFLVIVHGATAVIVALALRKTRLSHSRFYALSKIITNQVYSDVSNGIPLELSLKNNLESSDPSLRVLWFATENGYDPVLSTKSLGIIGLPAKIISMLLSGLNHAWDQLSFITAFNSIATYYWEVREHLVEKAKMFYIYVAVIATLILFSSWIMSSYGFGTSPPGFAGLVYTSVLSLILPVLLMSEEGYAWSIKNTLAIFMLGTILYIGPVFFEGSA